MEYLITGTVVTMFGLYVWIIIRSLHRPEW
jgi:hypothetical protein